MSQRDPDWETGAPRPLPIPPDELAPVPDELRALAEDVCEAGAVARTLLLGGKLAQTGTAWLEDGRTAMILCLHQPDWRERLTDALTAGGRPVRVGLAGGLRLIPDAAADMHPEVAVVAHLSIPAIRVLVLGPNGARGALIAHAPAGHELGEWQEIAVGPDDELAVLVERTMTS
jgi:hypothetical protein